MSAPLTPRASERRGELPLVARDPAAGTRTRRPIDMLAEAHNALVTRGDLVKLPGGGWRARHATHVEARNPAADDDTLRYVMVGDLFINSNTTDVFIATGVAAGAATWKQIA
jgi:hypothetical protein